MQRSLQNVMQQFFQCFAPRVGTLKATVISAHDPIHDIVPIYAYRSLWYSLPIQYPGLRVMLYGGVELIRTSEEIASKAKPGDLVEISETSWNWIPGVSYCIEKLVLASSE